MTPSTPIAHRPASAGSTEPAAGSPAREVPAPNPDGSFAAVLGAITPATSEPGGLRNDGDAGEPDSAAPRTGGAVASHDPAGGTVAVAAQSVHAEPGSPRAPLSDLAPDGARVAVTGDSGEMVAGEPIEGSPAERPAPGSGATAGLPDDLAGHSAGGHPGPPEIGPPGPATGRGTPSGATVAAGSAPVVSVSAGAVGTPTPPPTKSTAAPTPAGLSPTTATGVSTTGPSPSPETASVPTAAHAASVAVASSPAGAPRTSVTVVTSATELASPVVGVASRPGGAIGRAVAVASSPADAAPASVVDATSPAGTTGASGASAAAPTSATAGSVASPAGAGAPSATAHRAADERGASTPAPPVSPPAHHGRSGTRADHTAGRPIDVASAGSPFAEVPSGAVQPVATATGGAPGPVGPGAAPDHPTNATEPSGDGRPAPTGSATVVAGDRTQEDRIGPDRRPLPVAEVDGSLAEQPSGPRANPDTGAPIPELRSTHASPAGEGRPVPATARTPLDAAAAAAEHLRRAEVRRLAGVPQMVVEVDTEVLGHVRIDASTRAGDLQMQLSADDAGGRAMLGERLGELRAELRDAGLDPTRLDLASGGGARSGRDPAGRPGRERAPVGDGPPDDVAGGAPPPAVVAAGDGNERVDIRL